MKSLITAAVLPILAYGLAPHVIEDIPVPSVASPSRDNRIPAKETPLLPFKSPHGPSIKALMNLSSVASFDDLFPRPTFPWLASLPRPQMGSVPYGEIITSCVSPDAIALTFDDGPWTYTSDLLDVLAAGGARATFFVCGGNMGGDGQLTRDEHPGVLRRMVGDGHQVGSHTWGHADLEALGDDEEAVLSQLLRNEQGLVEALGVIPTYFRPPYFSAGGRVLGAAAALGYHVVNAGVDTLDWVGDYDAARENFDEALRRQGDPLDDDPDPDAGGGIVLAHDIHERTVYELAEYMIERARDAGYRLVTVGECLGDSPRNWYRDPSTGGSWMSRSRGPGRGRGRGRKSGRGRWHGRGRGRGSLVERLVVPPPDASKDESSPDDTAPSTGHKLHIHTLPPFPTANSANTVPAAAVNEADLKIPVKVPFTFLSGYLPRQVPNTIPTRGEANGRAMAMKTKRLRTREKNSAVPGTHVAKNSTRKLSSKEERPLEEACPHRRRPHGEGRRQEGEEHNHNEEQEHEHEHDHEQEEEQAHKHSVAGNATATGSPVSAEGIRDSTATWGLVVAAVVSLCFLYR